MLAFLNNLGPMEIGIIFFVVLLLFGAKKIPELARGFGKSLGEFRKARQEFEEEIEKAGDSADKEMKNLNVDDSKIVSSKVVHDKDSNQTNSDIEKG